MKSKIFIFTEAGKGIGFGHLTRCQAIAEQFRSMGWEVRLNVYMNNIGLHDPQIEPLNWLNQHPTDLFKAEDFVLVDSYLVSNDWLATAQKYARKLVQIDDFNRMIYPVDLIINPNAFADELDYSAQTAKWVGGLDYIILRKAFRKAKFIEPLKDKGRILITVGGSDYRRILPKLARWSLQSSNLEVRVVQPDSVSDLPEQVIVLPLLNQTQMLDEMSNADIVISACGQTLHELAALRKAVIGIGLDVDQAPNHKFYNEVGFINDQLWWDQPDLEAKVKAQISHLSDASAREDRVNQSPPINVHGVEKVASAIIE